MSAEAFQTFLSCDMRTAPDGRSGEYAERGTCSPRWRDIDEETGGFVKNGWFVGYLYAENAVRIAATAVRDGVMEGSTGDHPDRRNAAADALDAVADLVRLLALDAAYDSTLTDSRWQATVDSVVQVVKTARDAGVPQSQVQ